MFCEAFDIFKCLLYIQRKFVNRQLIGNLATSVFPTGITFPPFLSLASMGVANHWHVYHTNRAAEPR